MLFFPPVKFTFSFSKRLPQCLIWTFRSTDRFIYSAGGEGPFQSCASPDKAPADCHSNSMLNTSLPNLLGSDREVTVLIFPSALCKSRSVAFTLLKGTSIQQTHFNSGATIPQESQKRRERGCSIPGEGFTRSLTNAAVQLVTVSGNGACSRTHLAPRMFYQHEANSRTVIIGPKVTQQTYSRN